MTSPTPPTSGAGLRPVSEPLDDEQTRHVLEQLAVLVATGATVEQVVDAATTLLRPFGYQPAAIALAARITWQVSNTTIATVAGLPGQLHLVAARYALGKAGTHALRSLASASPTATAAYFLNASHRLQTAIDQHGLPGLPGAARDELRFFGQHVRAQRARTRAAANVDAAAREHGTVLGWYAHDDDRTTPECADADGTNFLATRVPPIGWPGTPHGGTCRCWAGAAHMTARSTYDVAPLTRAQHRTDDRERRTG